MKAIDDEIVPRGGEMTVLELVKKYLLQKREYGITQKQITILFSILLRKRTLVKSG